MSCELQSCYVYCIFKMAHYHLKEISECTAMNTVVGQLNGDGTALPYRIYTLQNPFLIENLYACVCVCVYVLIILIE